MILAVSRFRVRNGMEQAVEDAFHRRPHLVDSAPGFLGMEVLTDAKDAALFYLVTRWTDEGSFRTWNSSPAHKQSHGWIPRGLKLDPAYTGVVVLERLHRTSLPLPWDEIAADAAPVLARHISESRAVHCIVASPDGTIQACNSAVAKRIGAAAEHLVGRMIWDHLSAADAASLRKHVEAGERNPEEKFLLNFVDAEHFPYTLECRLDVQPTGFILLGEVPLRQDEALQEQLLQLNNQLTVLSRDNERKRKALSKTKAKLEKTLEDLNTSYRHLKKIQEVLPICMGCGKVRTGESKWDEAVKYRTENAIFLSHSYCPGCFERLEEELDLAEG